MPSKLRRTSTSRRERTIHSERFRSRRLLPRPLPLDLDDTTTLPLLNPIDTLLDRRIHRHPEHPVVVNPSTPARLQPPPLLLDLRALLSVILLQTMPPVLCLTTLPSLRLVHLAPLVLRPLPAEQVAQVLPVVQDRVLVVKEREAR
jgi:hypothetical protein